MNVIITHHAALRFQERHAPHLSLDIAKRHLAEVFPTAAKLKCRTWAGTEQWRVDNPSCTLVTKRDPGNVIAVVTVLPSKEDDTDQIMAEWLADKESAKQQAQRTAAETKEHAIKTAKRAEAVLTNAESQLKSRMDNFKILAKKAPLSVSEQMVKQLQAAENEVLRLKKHADYMERTSSDSKSALRFALRALLGHMEVGEALEAINEINPGLLTNGFVGPE